MSNDKIFTDGLIAKHPHPNAPDFVKANLSFKMKDFIAWAQQHHKEGWVNVQLKEGKSGKLYCELDTFTPSKREEYDAGAQQAREAVHPQNAGGKLASDFDDQDVPF